MGGRLEADTRFVTSLAAVAPEDWDRLNVANYPFLAHTFLYGLERSGCTTADTGWQPCHLLLECGGTLLGALPLYLKSHSYGEYVFDWSWASAWERCGLPYYPKLVSAIPFTPAYGPRLLLAPGIDRNDAWAAVARAVQGFAQKKEISSWHVLFPGAEDETPLQTAGLQRRVASQFHWFNEGYRDFDHYLASFSSRKRKSLKRERRRVADQGLHLRTLTGAAISPEHWRRFHHFYQMTYAKRSGHGGYLNRAFFTEVAPALGDSVIMILAEAREETVAAALCFRSDDTLYGRYWGCLREYDCLHFEACYYQGIEYCIANRLARFDPGAQGEHKIQRGFRPLQTCSYHWIAEPQLAAAVADFTAREAQQVADYIAAAEQLLPFRDSPSR